MTDAELRELLSADYDCGCRQYDCACHMDMVEELAAEVLALREQNAVLLGELAEREGTDPYRKDRPLF